MGGYAPIVWSPEEQAAIDKSKNPSNNTPLTGQEAEAIAAKQYNYRGSYANLLPPTISPAQQQQQITYGSPAWYANEISNRETAAKKNTLATPTVNPYISRSDYTKPSDLGDSKTQELIRQGYSTEQALTIQENDAKDERSRAYYENERQKALESNVSVSSGYHHWALDTGLPQVVNPFEYTGDLSLYTLKGEQQKGEQVSPVNPGILGLPGGQGVQNAAWDRAVARSRGQPVPINPDFNQAMNVIAESKQRQSMGPYGKLSSYSSTLGTLSLEQQQVIGAKAAQSAGWEIRPDLQSMNPARQAHQLGFGKGGTITTIPHGIESTGQNNEPSGNDQGLGTFAGMPITSIGIMPKTTQKNATPMIPNQFGVSESWITGVPVIGQFAGMIPGLADWQVAAFPTSKVKDLPYIGNLAKNSALPLMTTFDYGTPYQQKVSDYTSGSPAYSRTFFTDAGQKSNKWTYPVVGGSETVTLSPNETVTPIIGTTSVIGLSNIGLFEKGVFENTYGSYIPTKEAVINSGMSFISAMQARTPTQIEAYSKKHPVRSAIVGASGDIYENITQHPFNLLGDYLVGAGVGKVYGMAVTGGSSLIGSAAISKIPMLSTVGRAASTPLATDVWNIGQVGLGTEMLAPAAINIYNQPTLRGKITTAGNTGISLLVFGRGFSDFATPTGVTTTNPYAGKQFFSGKRSVPYTEQLMIIGGDLVNSITQSKGQRAAIAEISKQYARSGKSFTPPENTLTEPNIGDLTHVEPSHIPSIRKALNEQPSVLYGSSTIDAQIGTGPAATILRNKALPSADVDVFTQMKAQMEKTAGVGAIAMDVHEFPAGYANVGQTANTAGGTGDYLFGNRYRVNPYIDEITLKGKPGYTGELSFEHLQVDYRKLSSAARDDIFDPMNKGYRLGKDISRLTRVGDYLGEVQNKGKPSTSGYDNLLKQTITYNEQAAKGSQPNIRTDTLFNIRARYEAAKGVNAPEAIGSPLSTGVIFPTLRSIAVGSIMGWSNGRSLKSTPGSITNISGISFTSTKGASSSASTPSTSSSFISPSISSIMSSGSSIRSSGSASPSIGSLLSGPKSPSTKSPSISVPSITPTKTPSPRTPSKPSPSVFKTPSIPSRTPSKTPTPRTPSRSPYKTPSTPPTPGIFSMPSFSPSSTSRKISKSSSFFAFREVAPTWTPAQQGKVLFTGKYEGILKSKRKEPGMGRRLRKMRGVKM